MSDVQARAKLRDQMVQALYRVDAIGDPDQLRGYADSIIESLTDRNSVGWLITATGVHEVIEVDHQDNNGEYVTYQVFTVPGSDEEDED